MIFICWPLIAGFYLGILDPRIVGDKPRWYTHYVQPLYFQVHNPHSRLGFDLYLESDSDESDCDGQVTTILEEDEKILEEDDEIASMHSSSYGDCSCCSSFDTSSDDSDKEYSAENRSKDKKKVACKNANHEVCDVNYFED